MDDARFDTLIRSFGMTYSRRGFSRLLGGMTAGGLLTALGATEAAGNRPGEPLASEAANASPASALDQRGRSNARAPRSSPSAWRQGTPAWKPPATQ
jgi:hypothetical protein